MIMVASQETAGPAAAVADVAKLLPELQRVEQRGGREPVRARRLHLLPADLDGADDGHARRLRCC